MKDYTLPKTVVHVTTKKEYYQVMDAYERIGWVWFGGKGPHDLISYEIPECIEVENNFACSDYDYARRQGYMILSFEVWKKHMDIGIDFPDNKITGATSDGHHTFNELYEYRLLYNAAFFNRLYADWVNRQGSSGTVCPVKSYRHSDGEPCFGKENYFVVVAQLPTGQISNHYKGKHWDLFKIPEVKKAPKWDGHTPQDVAKRLREYLTNPN